MNSTHSMLMAGACVGSALAVYGARLVELRTKRDTLSGEIKETTTLRLFVGVGTFTVFASLVEFGLRGFDGHLGSLIGGWICAVASMRLRHRAIRQLGKFWSLHVEIRQAHEFVQEGPFRWVRHPTYLSMVLEVVAVTCLLWAPVTLALSLLCLVPAILLRIRIEEQALIQKFGAAYETYRERTPALIPYKLSGGM